MHECLKRVEEAKDMDMFWPRHWLLNCLILVLDGNEAKFRAAGLHRKSEAAHRAYGLSLQRDHEKEQEYTLRNQHFTPYTTRPKTHD